MGTASKPTTVPTPSVRSPQELEALVRSLYSTFNARQLERGAALIADEGEWTDLPSGTTLRGPAGFLQFTKRWLAGFSDAQNEIINVLVSGDLVSVEFIGRGTHDGPFAEPSGGTIAPTGKKAELRCVDVIQFRGDKILRGRSYYDAFALFRQLGAVAPQPKQAVTQEVVRKPGEGKALWLLDSLYEVKIASSESGGALTAIEMTIAVGMGPPPHTHPGEETVCVLEGKLRYHIGTKTYEGGPGTIFHTPKGTVENFEPLDKPVRVLVIYTPGGIDEFFVEAGQPAERRELPPPSGSPPDFERLARIGAKYGMEFRLPEGR